MKHKIILDVDTGHDDMVAILMASGLKEIDLLGIVAVNGNQVLEKTLRNTLNVCQLIGESAPVFAGMDRPILRDVVVAGDIHGETGLDGPTFEPLVKEAEKTHGVQFIIDSVLAHPHEVTLVPTGPLTNIAMAFLLEPRLPSLVKQVVLMGGSMGKGNRTPYAEFNIFADGEAAHIVFSSKAPIVMMGLDVTLQVQLNEERFKQYEMLGTKTSRMFTDSMAFYMETTLAHHRDDPAMHDPCCIAYVVDPSIFVTEPHTIEVELNDQETYGKTYALEPKDEYAIQVGVGADTTKFWALLDRAFEHLP
ncbi:MAG: nucleoside hydrolase [Sphaerochaetaceae bacterium]|jgi:ribosylpyrimidine nucleosidase